MAFTITFPIDIGTYVIVDHEDIDLSDPKNLHGRFGTIACYQCVENYDDDYIVTVSGYKDAWCENIFLAMYWSQQMNKLRCTKRKWGL